MTDNITILGIDIGGTNIRAGLVQNQKITRMLALPTTSNKKQENVLNTIIKLIEKFMDIPVSAIGIGVAGFVDVQKGIVYDAVNVPQWKEVHLKTILNEKFHIPIIINNDSNCFAIGEKHFGKGKQYNSLTGITLGTGLGMGLIFNGRLYEGNSCGAGELGAIPYLANNYEYYCCGQFFKNEYRLTASEAYSRAIKGDATSLEMFDTFGIHLGNMLMAVLYAYDPELIILGGSVSRSFLFFKNSMYKALGKFMYKRTLTNLKIEVSEIENIAIFGAASLFYNNY